MSALSNSKVTDRQKQVVELIAAGCSNEEIGERLGISPRTAKAHCDVLRQKLGVARRRQIPVAYRLLTGDDPLSKSLKSALADDTSALALSLTLVSCVWMALGLVICTPLRSLTDCWRSLRSPQ